MVRLLLVGDSTRIPGSTTGQIITMYSDDIVLGDLEQKDIDSGLFTLVSIDDTIENVRSQLLSAQPQVMFCWVDPDTSEIKQLVNKPQYPIIYTSTGGYQSTIILDPANHVLTNHNLQDQIDAMTNELTTKSITLDCMSSFTPGTAVGATATGISKTNTASKIIG